MIYVVNDLHGAWNLICRTSREVCRMRPGDVLVINGDGAGARGPRMNEVTKVFYEVRRGESDIPMLLDQISSIICEEPDIPEEWIFRSAHAGIFRKLVANRYKKFEKCMRFELENVIEDTLRPIFDVTRRSGVKVIYLPGNGEIVPDDFLVEDDFANEHTVEPEQRFYQKLNSFGFFWRFNVEYVPYAKMLTDEVVAIGTDLLDVRDENVMLQKLDEAGFLAAKRISHVLVHYPPAIAPIGGKFDFWSPNASDLRRVDALKSILTRIPTQNMASVKVFYGHIHLGAKDPRMDAYPDSLGVKIPDGPMAIWAKPGSVIPVI